MIKRILITLTLLIAVTGIAKAQKTAWKNANAAEFKAQMEKKKGVLIDLRTPDEIKKGKIKGAKEIDFLAPDAESRIDSLDKKKTYYIYCAGGGRSGDCAELMTKKGFKNVVNLQKGFSEWKKAGYEVEMK